MSQKPQITSYFDQAYFELEQQLLFSQAPQYVGHQLMCANLYDYHSIDWLQHSKLLYHAPHNFQLIDNICRHRQAIMLHGHGNSQHLVCDIHKWTYNHYGTLIGAPGFNSLPQCKNLNIEPLVNWKGLLFRSNRNIALDLNNLGQFGQYIDFENYQYSNTIVTNYDFNWKTFIEVYAEDYHVDPFHPGLGNFVDCSGLEWVFGDWHHFQVVPIKNKLTQTSKSKLYNQWQQKVLQAYAGEDPQFGAVWMTYYPNIMIECYPKAIVIAIVQPLSATRCRVITEFYYPDEILGFDPEYVELHQQVYFETAQEDDAICYRMHNGRQALYNAGTEDAGPYQLPTEAGLQHFHQFLARVMAQKTELDSKFTQQISLFPAGSCQLQH